MENIMTPAALADLIDLPADAKAAALAFEIAPEEDARLRAAFDTEFKDFEAMIKEKDDPDMWVLALYLRWAADAFKIWRGAGIPDEIAVDTFRDITIWSNRYRARTGKIGLIEWVWHTIHIKMKIFRLGRLQFEPVLLKEDTPLAPEGTEVLSVHIPRGESMTAENIKASFDMAREFFPKYFGKSYDLYCCTSWLLAPQLESMISEKSSIAELRRYFTIYGEVTGYSQAEEYVFLEKLDDPHKYAEDTSLQRNFKKFLLEGGAMGMGKGIGRF